ncbi:ATP-binding protein, partial [Rhizobium leguminosarum]|nr:ATP-binding protein [Rhizobium leguminosarum]
MLKHWSIRNFKAFTDLRPIEFSMVNVLAGANSSGKSTLIQSILLLKQTLQYGAEDRPISLNGPLLRMGSFNDVRNFSTEAETLQIGLDLEINDYEMSATGNPLWSRSSNYSFQVPGSEKWEKITLALLYGTPYPTLLNDAHVQERNRNPDLVHTTLSMFGRVDDRDTYRLFSFEKNYDGRWPYDIETDGDSAIEMIDNRPDGSIAGGFISFFLPSFTVVNFNQTEAEISTLIEALFQSSSSTMLGGLRSLFDDNLSDKIVSVINEWLTAHGAEPFPADSELVSVSDARAKLRPFVRPKLFADLLKEPLEVPDAVVTDIALLKETIRAAAIADRGVEFRYAGSRSAAIEYGNNYITEFFKFGIRYLGPLRDSPRPVYQPEALESTTDVGYRGEHTAAVFEINKYNLVGYHLPPDVSSEADYVGLAQSDTKPLEGAAASWLQLTCHCEFPPGWIRVRPIKGRTNEEAEIYGRADYCSAEGAGGRR